jgi:hypothetical protein
MPVILRPADYEEWLMRADGKGPPVNLLRPFPADEMKAEEAHKHVGNVRNNLLELLNSAEMAVWDRTLKPAAVEVSLYLSILLTTASSRRSLCVLVEQEFPGKQHSVARRDFCSRFLYELCCCGQAIVDP